MRISDNGLTLIKSFEGLRLDVYDDGGGTLTVGWGHTGADVNALGFGTVITEEKATELLKQDIERFEKNVNSFNGNYNFNQNEFDALVSFAYNIGSINSLCKNGNASREEIAKTMLTYVYCNGEVFKGLVRRRQAEHDLFLTPVQTSKINIDEVAKEVINGKYGNGEERKRLLGANYDRVQKRVNELLSSDTSTKLDYNDIVNRVIKGEFGNGHEVRKPKIESLGYDYEKVRQMVNERMR